MNLGFTHMRLMNKPSKIAKNQDFKSWKWRNGIKGEYLEIYNSDFA